MIDTNKYSILSILARTVRLSRQILQQWRVVLIYAATLTIVGLLFGYWGYMCQNGGGILCYSLGRSSYMSVGVLLWLKKTFKISDIFGVSKAKAKAMAVLLGYGVAFVVPVLVAAKILAMPANPDWRVEMLNFLLIFALFMLQLFMMRTIAALSMFLEQKKHLNMWQIYEKTIGSGYVSIILFLCLLAFSLLTYMIIAVKMDSIGRWFDSVTWFAVVNFADNALKLVYMALMLVFCRAQHELLQPESLPAEDVDLEAANEDNAAPVIAEKPAETKIKKSVAKKRTTQKSATKTAEKQLVEKAKKTEVAKAKTAENKKKPAKKTTALKKQNKK